jgi:HPt (histidine-containing phosphotransfer) domain-containing protein
VVAAAAAPGSAGAGGSGTAGPAPVFDVEAALGFIGGNRELLVRSIRMFVASNEHDEEQILGLISAGELKTAARRFHRLKGSSAMIGCRRLSEISASLERDLKAADGAAPAAERLRTFSEVMRLTLHALRQHAGAATH